MDAVTYYSKVAADFHASYREDANRLERVRVWKSFLDTYTKNAKSAYDIGCGSGILACELVRRGVETVGIDGAAGMIEIARETAKAQGLGNIRFEQHYLPPAQAGEPLFPPACLVIASSAIEYMDSIPESLGFISRLLTSGGVTVFSVSNQDSVSRKIVRMVYNITGRPLYFGLLQHFMTVDTIKSALQEAGLEFLESAYFGKADRVNRLLGQVLPERFSSNMIIVAARKA